jgi:hypothetical protein
MGGARNLVMLSYLRGSWMMADEISSPRVVPARKTDEEILAWGRRFLQDWERVKAAHPDSKLSPTELWWENYKRWTGGFDQHELPQKMADAEIKK